MSSFAWDTLIHDSFNLSEVAKRLETLRKNGGLNHEDFARHITRTPSALNWFIVSSNLRFQTAHPDTPTRFALIAVLLERLVHQAPSSHQEHLDQIARATVKTQGVNTLSYLICNLLSDEKARGTFRDSHDIKIQVESLVFSAAQGSIESLFLVTIPSQSTSWLLDPVGGPALSGPAQSDCKFEMEKWSPDPRILRQMKEQFFIYLKALKPCPDRATIRRIASLIYYAAELSYKGSNFWYSPPRFFTDNPTEAMNAMTFQQADMVATDRLIDLGADLTMADYIFPGRGIPFGVLQSKSIEGIRLCGLEEVPKIVDWLEHET